MQTSASSIEPSIPSLLESFKRPYLQIILVPPLLSTFRDYVHNMPCLVPACAAHALDIPDWRFESVKADDLLNLHSGIALRVPLLCYFV